MRRLFKVGSAGIGKRARRELPGDWYCKVRLGPYEQRRVRPCTNAGVSESWANLLQSAVDRKAACEPPTPDMLKQLPRRLLECLGLISEVSKKRRGTYAVNVEDYVRELRTDRRDAKYVKSTKRWLTWSGKRAAGGRSVISTATPLWVI